MSDCQSLSQGPLPSHEQAGKHMHVVLSASLVGSRLSLRMRGIPHHRKRVPILGSQKEEQRIKYDSRCQRGLKSYQAPHTC